MNNIISKFILFSLYKFPFRHFGNEQYLLFFSLFYFDVVLDSYQALSFRHSIKSLISDCSIHSHFYAKNSNFEHDRKCGRSESRNESLQPNWQTTDISALQSKSPELHDARLKGARVYLCQIKVACRLKAKISKANWKLQL